MTAKTLFEVQTFTFCDGWINCWSVSDEHGTRPETFSTQAEAQAEIDELFQDIALQIEVGERDPDDGYNRDEYQIVEIPADTYRKEPANDQ